MKKQNTNQKDATMDLNKKKIIGFTVALVGFIAALISIYSFLFLEERPLIKEEIKDPSDGNYIFLNFEKYNGQSIALDLKLLTKRYGGSTKFNFTSGAEIGCSDSDPHKLCFTTGGNYEIALKFLPKEIENPSFGEIGNDGIILLRFPSWGSYIYGYEDGSDYVSLKGTFIIQSFGHIGQSYWAAELRPTGG